jgi:hypothetical protein
VAARQPVDRRLDGACVSASRRDNEGEDLSGHQAIDQQFRIRCAQRSRHLPVRGPGSQRGEIPDTVAHELHHIGYGSSCPDAKTTAAITSRPERVQTVLNWIGAFGEGFAMLAAAGGPEVHPHATSNAEEEAVWDRSIEQYSRDRQQVEAFFLDVLSGRLTGEAVQQRAVRLCRDALHV